MRDFRDSKTMAQSLRTALADTSVTVTHSQSLELIAKAFGYDNWNILAAKVEAEKPPPLAEPAPAQDGAKTALHCSFCGKSQYEVDRLIAGPSVFICDTCVGLCDGILLEKDVGRRLAAARANRPGDDTLEVAREAFADFSNERLLTYQTSLADGLDHIEWGLREASRALARKPGEPWQPDPYAAARGWKRGPMAEKSPEEVRAHKAALERRATASRRDVELLARVLKERGVDPAGPPAA